MKGLKFYLILYILISQQILSNAKYIDFGILSEYPYTNHLEKLLGEYDKLNGGSIYSMLLNMDPQTLQSIGKDIATIVQLGGKGVDSAVKAGKSLYSGIKSLGGYSKKALFLTIDILKKYHPHILIGATVATAVALISKKLINDLNDFNDRIGVLIQELINNGKYKRIIGDIIGKDLENIIAKGISNLNLTKHIIDFLNKENIIKKLDYKFKQKIDSLNFILLGDTDAGKSTLLNQILELSPEDTGAYVNPDFIGPTTMEFKKYRNETKKGIDLIDSRGIEPNEDYNANYFKEDFKNYFESIRNESNSNFIYGILFISESYSSSEIDILNYLNNMFDNKIPLKLLYTKRQEDSQAKRINNTIKSKISGIKPYFFNITSNSEYEKNLNNFLKDLFEELNEKKLKDIYQFYYSLDIFNNFKLIMEKINAKQNILIHSMKKKIDPIENIINNLEFDLKFFLINPDINREDIKNFIKKIYNSFVNELNEDLQKLQYKDYPLKEYENRNIFYKFKEKVKEFFTSNNLPSDYISYGISGMINDFILHLFLKTVQKEYFKNPIQVPNYPDFTSIKNEIKKNFIKIQDKTNNSYYYIYILIAIVIIIAFIILFYKCCCQKKEKKEKKERKEQKQELIELSEY